jgi:hypothetical protein
VVHGGAQCHQTGADDRQDAHLIWVSAHCIFRSWCSMGEGALEAAVGGELGAGVAGSTIRRRSALRPFKDAEVCGPSR